MIIKVAVPHRFQFRVISAMPMVPFWQQKTNDVHYIGGSEVLPAPLSAQEEQRALEQLGTDRDSQAKALLIEHNLRLVVYIAKKFDNTGRGFNFHRHHWTDQGHQHLCAGEKYKISDLCFALH